MAEQDIYGRGMSTGSFPLDKAADRLDKASQHLPHAPGGAGGAEQDLYGSHFSSAFEHAKERFPHVSRPAQAKVIDGYPADTAAEQDRYGSHFRPGSGSGSGPGFSSSENIAAVGLLNSTVLPSFSFHAAFSAIAYGISRYTDRAEGKDWLWPTGMTLNAWYSALGTRVLHDGLPLSTAWSSLNYSERLLLGGVTAWGVRLLSRIATRGIERRTDDPRYTTAKQDPGFWNKALANMFLPEAAAQTLISLPFVLPFRARGESILASPAPGDVSRCGAHSLAVFLFSAGFALEVLADLRLAKHKKEGDKGICRDGVWSVVRHPNYLGDALIHASFPILLIGAGLFHPLAALGPIVNYVFLRFVGGDRENERNQAERYAKEDPVKAAQFQDYQKEKNSFWPDLKEASNKWSWIVVGAGAAGVLLERGLRSLTA